jgi:hypothetical protein
MIYAVCYARSSLILHRASVLCFDPKLVNNLGKRLPRSDAMAEKRHVAKLSPSFINQRKSLCEATNVNLTSYDLLKLNLDSPDRLPEAC